MVLSISFGLIIFALHTVIPKAFTSNKAVYALQSQNMIYLAVYFALDCIRFALQGIFRGLGKQKEIYLGAFILYYMVGVPVSAYLGLVMNQGISGLMIGIILGNSLVCIYFSIQLKYKVNIDSAIIECKERDEYFKKHLSNF